MTKNERKKARTLLSETRQRNHERLLDFITRCEELMAQVGGEGWQQDIHVDTLKYSLNKEMQSRLVVYQLMNPTYNTFRSAYLSIDAKLQAIKMGTSCSYQRELPGSTNRSDQG